MASINSSTIQPAQYAKIFDQTDADNIYIGYAVIATATSAAKWQIRKLQTVSNVLSILWANGSTKADQIWDNRASLSYS